MRTSLSPFTPIPATWTCCGAWGCRSNLSPFWESCQSRHPPPETSQSGVREAEMKPLGESSYRLAGGDGFVVDLLYSAESAIRELSITENWAHILAGQ